MLNELHDLADAVDAAAVPTISWHPNLRNCPRGPALRLLLNADGAISTFEVMNDSDVEMVRKWEVAAGVSFPAFNVPRMIHAPTPDAKQVVKDFLTRVHGADEVDAEPVEQLIDTLLRLGTPLWHLDDPSDPEFMRVRNCLDEHPLRLAKRVGTVPQAFAALGELVARVYRLDNARLHDALREFAVGQICARPAEAKKWLDLIVVSTARKPPRKYCLTCEVADRSQFEYPANHPRVQRWINERLEASDRSSVQTDGPDQPSATLRQRRTSRKKASPPNELDAFGLSAAGSNMKFPEMRQRVLVKFSMRAMNSESPCQNRYQRADESSFRIGREVRQRMKASVEWLWDETRRGITWQDVSGACGFAKKNNRRVPVKGILLAYPTVLPRDPPELGAFFASAGEGGTRGADFEACAARVVPAVKGIVHDHPEVEISVFVLTLPDGFRARVAASRRFSAERLLSAAADWQRGARNLPSLSFNLGTDASPQWRAPLVPYPVDVAKCASVAWQGSGTRAIPVQSLTINEGLNLMIGSDADQSKAADRVLRRAIVNASPLLLAAGHADHRRQDILTFEGNSAAYAKHLQIWPSIIGILLFKRSILIGDYMHASYFLTGRLMALADALHKEYCRHVRKKYVRGRSEPVADIPPQLIGNALMPTAADNPERAIVRLRERLLVYQAWATKADGDEYRLAKWALGQIAQVCHELSQQEIPTRTDDAAKAQVLLGYLAKFESRRVDPPPTNQQPVH